MVENLRKQESLPEWQWERKETLQKIDAERIEGLSSWTEMKKHGSRPAVPEPRTLYRQ
jgi:hypothetical protein